MQEEVLKAPLLRPYVSAARNTISYSRVKTADPQFWLIVLTIKFHGSLGRAFAFYFSIRE